MGFERCSSRPFLCQAAVFMSWAVSLSHENTVWDSILRLACRHASGSGGKPC